jgi:putative transcriptional regulator
MKNNIRVERAILDITQEELARKINVSRQTIHAIENGKYIPSTLLAFKIAHFFNKTIENIFFLEESDLG